MKKTGGILLGFILLTAIAARAGYDEDYNSSFGAGMGLDPVDFASDLGIHWARMPIDVNPDHVNDLQGLFQMGDATLTNYQAVGIVPYGIINPRQDNGGTWISATQYAYLVSNLVERYDGDGVNDMEGLVYPVKVWELVNEYSSRISNVYTNLAQSNFVDIVVQGSQAMTSACPEALFAYDPFDTNDTLALLQQLSRDKIDIISFHTYAPLDAPDFEDNPLYLRNMTAYLQSVTLTNIPVWVTEYAFYDHEGAVSPSVAASQTDNARWLVTTTVWGFGTELFDKIIYTEVTAPLDSEERLDWMALVSTNGIKRQIYYGFQKLASLVDQYTAVQELSLGTNVYGYLFTVNSTNVAVVWSKEDTGTHTNVTVSGLSGSQATLIDAVPDTNGTFTTSTASISDGELIISEVTETPIYILSDSGNVTGRAVNDFDGDGKSDAVVYHETSGYWYVLLSSDGSIESQKLGEPGYSPVPRDYDGDGKADMTVYHESSGYWYILKSSDYTTASAKWGATGYTPAPGDYDGDGTADLTVYCESGDWPGYWYILKSSDYTMASTKWGATGYTPVPADYDGDGTADLAVYCESGDWPGYWYILKSTDYTMASTKWGATGYTPVPADYDGDGTADLAVYCESGDWPGYWYVLQSSDYTMSSTKWGATGYTPVPADYDGDGTTDLAVYHEDTGYWYFLNSSDLSVSYTQLGGPGYTPVCADR